MEIKLTPKESEKHFHTALCNGAGQLGYSGLQLDWDDNEYNEAKKTLQTKIDKGEKPEEMYGDRICREDVWMEILRNGGHLKINDIEGAGEYNRSIGIVEVHQRVQRTMKRHLIDMVEENDDAITADVVLQTVFFEEIVFG